MKRGLKWLAALLVVTAAILIGVTYPAVGNWTYHYGGRAEAALYGLHTEQVPAGDVTFTVYRGGTAPGRETVVLLHGYSADRQIWVRFARHLLDRYEVIIPDLAGHGETGFVSGLDYSGPAQARRVVAMLDALKIDKAHFVGNSMGGLISAHLGLSHADRTRSITLIDAAGLTSPKPSDLERMVAEQGRNPFEVHSRAEFDQFYAMTMAQPPWLPGFMLDAMAQRYEQRRPQLAEIFKFIYHRDGLDGHLAEIRIPTLVIWGDRDRLIDVSAAPLWASGIPGAKLYIFNDIGHMPMVERPAATAVQVEDFLNHLPR